MLKQYRHNPTHLFIDNQVYFITAACYNKIHLLKKDSIKKFLLEAIIDFAKRVHWKLDNWVILKNHYHFSIKSQKGVDLSYLMGNVHRKTAKFIREQTEFSGKTVWWNYWDYCPRDEADYFQHLNYMLYNPIKHGYVEDLKDYNWSSFHVLFDEFGHDYLSERFRRYGYKDLRIDFEDDDYF